MMEQELSIQAVKAAENMNREEVLSLIERGANDYTEIAFACTKVGYSDIVFTMLDKGIDCLTDLAMTAAEYGHLDIVNNIAERGEVNFLFVTVAAKGGHKEILIDVLNRVDINKTNNVIDDVDNKLQHLFDGQKFEWKAIK